MARRLMLAGGLAALALAGCSSLRATAAPGSPAPSRSATASAPVSAPDPSPSSATPRQTIAMCPLADLAVTTGEDGAGSGHWAVPLVFRNTGTATCRLRGYPGLAGLDATGAQTTQARRTPSGYLGGIVDPAHLPVVDLAPGATASALVEGTDHPDGPAATPCFQYRALLVTPPDETRSVRVNRTAGTCTDLQIHPVVPGGSGSQNR